MALTPQEELEQLKKLGEQLGKVGQINNEWLSDASRYVDDIVRKSLEWEEEIRIINNDLYGLKSVLEANLGELTNSNVQLIKARKNTRDLISVTQQLNNDHAGILDLNKQQLEKLVQKTKIANEELRATSMNLTLSQEQRDVARDNLRLGEEVLIQTEKRLELENEITKALGLTNGLAIGLKGVMQKMGLSKLSEQMGIDDAIQKTRDYTKEMVIAQQESGAGGSGLVNNLKSAGNLAKNLGSNLLKSLGPVALIAGAIAMIVDAMLSLDKLAGETAKQFGISYEQARGLNDEINQMAYNTGNVFIDSQKLNQSFLELSEVLGTNVMLSEEMLVNYTQLTQQAGYSKEAAATMSKLSLLTSKSSKEIAANFLGQVKAQNIKNGLAVNEKILLNDINNISKSTLLTYTAQGNELGTASVKAKMLGTDLKNLESISQSLLDIESSIGAEFESEVMTGKQLNLERARYAALTGDLGSLASELNKQGITAVSYGKMNVIQQEAQAKALGMSREEMSNMLMEGEALSKIGVKDKEAAREKYNQLVKQLGTEGAIKALGDEQLANQFASTSAQERFQATLAKLQDIFTQMAEPLMPILDVFGEIFTLLGPIIKLVMGNLMPGFKMIGLTISFISDTLKSIIGLFSGDGIDFSSTGKAFDGLIGSFNNTIPGKLITEVTGEKPIDTADDGIIGSDGGLMVSGPKGSVSLDKQDTILGNKNGVIAGTNLLGNGDGGSSNLSVLSSTLGSKMDIMINKLDNLVVAVNKGMVVNLDGNKVSQGLLTPIAINNRNI